MRSSTFIKEAISLNNILPVVTLLISGFMLLVILGSLNYNSYLDELETVVQKEEVESQKMKIVSDLMELARFRTHLTAQILITDDPFKQDSLNSKLESYANRFTSQREKLLSLPLSEKEKAILETHKNIIPRILPAQRQAVSIAMHEPKENRGKAQKLLYDIVYPGQTKLIGTFQKLIALEQEQISRLTHESNIALDNMQQRNKKVIFTTLTFMLGLSILVIFRIRKIQQDLRNAYNNLEQVNIQLEKKVIERTSELSELNKKLKDASEHDELTNIYNRRKFNDFIKNEYNRTNRVDGQFALILIDIDHFKEYNDNYGHQKGDDCLASVAALLSLNLPRSTDFIARYGGEEFVVILPSTDEVGAKEVAEHLRAAVENYQLPHAYSDVNDYITISLGVTVYHASDTLTVKDIIENADQCLYAAKAKGRNRVVSMS